MCIICIFYTIHLTHYKKTTMSLQTIHNILIFLISMHFSILYIIIIIILHNVIILNRNTFLKYLLNYIISS